MLKYRYFNDISKRTKIKNSKSGLRNIEDDKSKKLEILGFENMKNFAYSLSFTSNRFGCSVL